MLTMPIIKIGVMLPYTGEYTADWDHGLDWAVDIGSARKRVGDKVALQGNLDPAVLLSTPEAIEKEVASVLASYGHGSGHVFNLGHGITQWTPPENAAAMLQAVRTHSNQYHQ